MSEMTEKTECVAVLAVSGAFIAAVLLCVTLAVGALVSDGHTDYCYVIGGKGPCGGIPGTCLVAHRPWREDRVLAVVPTLDDARAAAQQLKCPLR